jgi:hypothetical protein
MGLIDIVKLNDTHNTVVVGGWVEKERCSLGQRTHLIVVSTTSSIASRVHWIENGSSSTEMSDAQQLLSWHLRENRTSSPTAQKPVIILRVERV